MIAGIQRQMRLQDDIIMEMIKNEYDVKNISSLYIYMTYKQRFNKAFDFDKDEDHSLTDLKNITGIPLRILKEVYKRGEGAYYNNLGSVRLKDFTKNPDLRKGMNMRLSMTQWSYARVYAFIYKSLFQKMRYKKQDTDLYDEIEKFIV
jgi:hypothetical protein